MPDDLPIFGICGHSGSGKTTLLEAVVPRLRERGLEVAVVKHDVHGLDFDRAGKDSDRLFRTGADVYLADPEQHLSRRHPTSRLASRPLLRKLGRRYDLVLVEGFKDLPLPKVWLLGQDEEAPPEGSAEVIAHLGRDADRRASFLRTIEAWLPERWLKTPAFGCVLVGGASVRMGRPKHLLEKDGRTWLERTVDLLERVTEEVAIVGKGEVPEALANHLRLPDVPEAKGPLSGILAAMRWAPGATWLVAACDLPDLGEEALRWLLETRAPGVWATLPRGEEHPDVEPLLAHYDLRARPLLEHLAAEGDFRLSHLASHAKVITPSPPPELASAWRNVNTAAGLNPRPSAVK